jgi:hypothetical protein
LVFEKWTKINVQKPFSENNLGKTSIYALYNKWAKLLKENQNPWLRESDPSLYF